MREERAYEILRSLMTGAAPLDCPADVAERCKACEVGAAAVALIAAEERLRIASAALEMARHSSQLDHETMLKLRRAAYLDDEVARLDEGDARTSYNNARLNP